MGSSGNKDLLAISYAAAVVLAEGKKKEDVETLGNVLNLIGDALAVLAAGIPESPASSGLSASSQSSAFTQSLQSSAPSTQSSKPKSYR